MEHENEPYPWQQGIILFASGLAIYAALGHPRQYSIYTLTRWAISIAAITNVICLPREQLATRTAQAVLALIFNPILPLHLNREAWLVLDLLAPPVLFWGKRSPEQR